MTKKRAITLLIVLSLILFIFLAGYTFAKYYTVVDGAGSAGIAKWSFVARDNNNNINNIALIDTADEVSLVNNKIAPGTKGSFDIIIDATGSEVGVDYSVKVISETNKPTNMLFNVKAEDGTEAKVYSSLEELALKELKGNIAPVTGNQVRTITVEWEWPYETVNGDSADNTNGIQAGLYEFALQIEGKQAKI